jgi:hypothetical protein
MVQIWHPNVPARICIFYSSTFMGTIKDLQKFIFSVVDRANDWSRHLRKKSCLAIAGMMMKVSSAD